MPTPPTSLTLRYPLMSALAAPAGAFAPVVEGTPFMLSILPMIYPLRWG